MPFVAVAEPVHGLAVGETMIDLSPLQRLYMRLLVNTNDHHRLLRRVQIEADHVGAFGPNAGSVVMHRIAPSPREFSTRFSMSSALGLPDREVFDSPAIRLRATR